MGQSFEATLLAVQYCGYYGKFLVHYVTPSPHAHKHGLCLSVQQKNAAAPFYIVS